MGVGIGTGGKLGTRRKPTTPKPWPEGMRYGVAKEPGKKEDSSRNQLELKHGRLAQFSLLELRVTFAAYVDDI